MKIGSTIMVFIALVMVTAASAQLQVQQIERLEITRTESWHQPVFSPDGQSVFFTNIAYDGIWKYDLRTKETEVVTRDPRSGYGFAQSSDGKKIAYRRTFLEGTPDRKQQIILQQLDSKKSSIISEGADIPVPVFSGAEIITSAKNVDKPEQLQSTKPHTILLGIEEMKISLQVDGQKRLLDPMGKGSYIWPSLSPDGTKLVAYEMERGAFISDLMGRMQTKLGRLDAPAWTRDGRWIISMNDRDDGHQILSSELWCTSVEGQRSFTLTGTDAIKAISPNCSPVENKIVAATLDGEIVIISYEEAGQ